MALDDNQIIELVKNPANKKDIQIGRDLQVEHKVHVTGDGFLRAIKFIDGFENELLQGTKKLVAQPFTKLTAKTVIDTQSRWTNANGTVKTYFFRDNDKEREKEFRKDILSQVWKGQSMDYFIKNFFRKALYTDFNGFLLVEQPRVVVNDQGAFHVIGNKFIRVESANETPKPHIVFISASKVVDALEVGNTVEYILYEFSKEKTNRGTITKLRYIDDRRDLIIVQDTSKSSDYFISQEDVILDNELGYTPVVKISTNQKRPNNDNIKTSYIDESIEAFNILLNQYSTHSLTLIMHGFPTLAMAEQACTYNNGYTSCSGGALIWNDTSGKSHNESCNNCDGTGKTINLRSDNIIVVPQQTQDGTQFNVNNVAGYVKKDIEIIREQKDEIKFITKNIEFVTTGMMNLSELSINKTATETMMNLQPLEDIISVILDNVEFVETFLTDTIGKLFYGDAYESSQIRYGT